MAKKLPDPLVRRHWLQKDMSASEALAVADAYLEEGRQMEAVAFLAKAEADDRLAELAEAAVAQGDAFLLRAVAQARRQEPEPAQWLALADAAERAGLAEYAHTARRQAEVRDD